MELLGGGWSLLLLSLPVTLMLLLLLEAVPTQGGFPLLEAPGAIELGAGGLLARLLFVTLVLLFGAGLGVPEESEGVVGLSGAVGLPLEKLLFWRELLGLGLLATGWEAVPSFCRVACSCFSTLLKLCKMEKRAMSHGQLLTSGAIWCKPLHAYLAPDCCIGTLCFCCA